MKNEPNTKTTKMVTTVWDKSKPKGLKVKTGIKTGPCPGCFGGMK